MSRPDEPDAPVPGTVQPVPAATSAPESLKGDASAQEPDRAARAIGRRAAEIRATVPDLELGRDVDVTAALELADTRGWSTTALLVRACATALREQPWANAAYRDGRFERYGRVNVGVTVQTDGGQSIASVLDADAKDLDALTAEIARLTDRARAGELTAPEQAGTTFTLSDYAQQPGVDRWSALVIAPQAAALAAGSAREAPVLRDGAVAPGRVMSLTLTCDHRILYGARAAALLQRIAELVEGPQR